MSKTSKSTHRKRSKRSAVLRLAGDELGASRSMEIVMVLAVGVLVFAAMLKMALKSGGLVDHTKTNVERVVKGEAITGGIAAASTSAAAQSGSDTWVPPTLTRMPNVKSPTPTPGPVPQPLPTPTPGPVPTTVSHGELKSGSAALTWIDKGLDIGLTALDAAGQVAGKLRMDSPAIVALGKKAPEILEDVKGVGEVARIAGPVYSLGKGVYHLTTHNDCAAIKDGTSGALGMLGGWGGAAICAALLGPETLGFGAAACFGGSALIFGAGGTYLGDKIGDHICGAGEGPTDQDLAGPQVVQSSLPKPMPAPLPTPTLPPSPTPTATSTVEPGLTSQPAATPTPVPTVQPTPEPAKAPTSIATDLSPIPQPAPEPQPTPMATTGIQAGMQAGIDVQYGNPLDLDKVLDFVYRLLDPYYITFRSLPIIATTLAGSDVNQTGGDTNEIVSASDVRAAYARTVLKEAGIALDDATNHSHTTTTVPAREGNPKSSAGVGLTDRYFNEVNQRLRTVRGKGGAEVRHVLAEIAGEKQAGTFPR